MYALDIFAKQRVEQNNKDLQDVQKRTMSDLM